MINFALGILITFLFIYILLTSAAIVYIIYKMHIHDIKIEAATHHIINVEKLYENWAEQNEENTLDFEEDLPSAN